MKQYKVWVQVEEYYTETEDNVNVSEPVDVAEYDN